MTPPKVRFGEGLQAPEHGLLRAKLSGLAVSRLDCSLYVDLVASVSQRSPVAGSPFEGRHWCILLDIHRIFLFECSLDRAVSMWSLSQFVTDDWRADGIPIGHAAYRHNYSFLYSLESLDVLVDLWSRPTHLVATIDLSTCEVTWSVPQHYPRLPDQQGGAASNLTISSQLELDSTAVGQGWRIANERPLHDLVSRYTGSIRGEFVRLTSANVLCATTRVLWGHGKEEAMCGGVGLTRGEALKVARCEALERFQVAHMPDNARLMLKPYSALGDAAVDSRTIFFPDRAHRRADPEVDVPIYWTPATRVCSATETLIPAQEVWFSTDQLPGETIRIRPTTSGCALGNSVSEAALFALLELIERDAFLVMWYLEGARAKLNLDSFNHEPTQLLLLRLNLLFPGYRIHAFDIRSDIAVPVVAVFAVREYGSGPKTLRAAAARPMAASALFSALKELSLGFDAIAASAHEGPLKSADQVFSPDDHRSYYARDDRFPAFSFLDFDHNGTLDPRILDSTSVFAQVEEGNLRDAVLLLSDHLERLGMPVYLKDITHELSSSRGLFAVKAIVPGSFPIWYGARHLRFQLTDRLKRLASALTGRVPRDASELNLAVHPLG